MSLIFEYSWSPIICGFSLKLGPAMPKKLIGHSMIGYGQEELITIGGMDRHKNFQKHFYRLTCSSGICKWSTMNQKLKDARSVFVAIPLKNSMASCN